MFNLNVFDKLEIFEIYDEYLEPIFFSAVNCWDEYFLVYWSGDYDDGDTSKWLLCPISKRRLNDLAKLRINVPDVFSQQELKVIVHNNRNNQSFIDNNMDGINFPPEDFIFEPEDIEPVHPEAHWAFEIGISKKQSNPSVSLVSKTIDLVTDVISALIPDETRRNISFNPLNARYSSFNVRVGTSDIDASDIAISRLWNLFQTENNVADLLSEYRLDAFRLKELLEISVESKATIKLTPKRPDVFDDKQLEIQPGRVVALLDQLSDITRSFVDSIKIPQANELHRVIDIVVRKVDGLSITHTEIEGLSSSRQVKYYTDAAYTLGLMERNAVVTSSGRFLARLESRESQLCFVADKFETSEVGLAWIQWAGVESISELDGASAANFINQCARGLSEDTAKRRASTLQKWLKLLQGLSRRYESLTP